MPITFARQRDNRVILNSESLKKKKGVKVFDITTIISKNVPYTQNNLNKQNFFSNIEEGAEDAQVGLMRAFNSNKITSVTRL